MNPQEAEWRKTIEDTLDAAVKRGLATVGEWQFELIRSSENVFVMIVRCKGRLVMSIQVDTRRKDKPSELVCWSSKAEGSEVLNWIASYFGLEDRFVPILDKCAEAKPKEKK